ncbi:MAG: carbohydrate ABC transporter substrate-binding protein [Clostridia bacterium]|nr:carbohydrate ABC transporter substrate-binding protein [Clostridia bacterium]
MKKWLTLLLALCVLAMSFVGCNEASDPSDSSSEESDGATSETDSESASNQGTTGTIEIPSILDNVKFKGEVVQVLSWQASNLTEYEEELLETSTLLQQAVYNRCDYAQTRLNVVSKWRLEPSSGFVDLADRENSNGGNYDLIVNNSEQAAPLMSRGVYSNLRQYEYLDFNHDGWARSLLEDVTVRNKLYFATGDISTNLVFMTSVVYFNKDLVKDLGINEKIAANYGVQNLYELVTSGKWTLDKLITLSEDVYKDTDNSGTKGPGDRFGFTTYHNLFENFYYGGGHTTIVVDGDTFSVSPDFLNAELVGGILEKANGLLHGQNGYIETNYSAARTQFAAGNVLFTMGPASHADNTYSNTEDLNYSVLPIPKNSETQKAYACTQSTPYSVYCVASQGKIPTIAAAFMQALTEESYEVTRPALFDKLMKGRYAENPEDAEMWDYAVDANVFDVGRLFGDMFRFVEGAEPMTYGLFRDKIKSDNANWSNALGTSAVQMTIQASGIASEILGLPD